jgi:ABC-2 type transport system ATP-binding protein
MGTDEVVVETRGLTKRYGRFLALDGLTLSVGRGQILGFIGPNGAGKTTAIKILVGLARPTSGSAVVAGIDCVARPRELKRLIGYMPDTFGAYDNMRVSEYLDFFGAAFGIPRRARVRRIDEVLDMTRCPGFRDLFVESLSHGMRQRVALARTLLHDPVALILDEPANGLDPPARIEMRQLLLELARRGKSLIVTSHILPELARICDRVAIIARGRLRASGTLDEVARQLSPLRTVEVLLARADGLERAAEVLRRHPDSATDVTASPAELAVRFRTARGDDALAELLSALVAAGVGVAQLREVQTDLEEAFMTAARQGEAERETAAAAGVGP